MTKLPPPPTSTGSALKDLREQRGLTQQAFADKIGKSRTAVAAWEYGRSMSEKSRALVAKFFGVQPDALGAPWNPHASRPQYRRRQREEANFMDQLRDLANVGGSTPKVGVDPDDDDRVTFDPFTHRIGGAPMREIPDPELFGRLVGFWCAMKAEARPAFLDAAHDFASPKWHAAPERGARGKAQG